LRLRDLGGIIVIDFIDMVLESNRELVLRRLLECLARDRTKHQVAEVTSLGLVQMTRKRVGSGLLEAFSVPCEHCNGRGVIISLEPVDHSHGRDSGSGKDANSSRNAQHRDGSSQDSGGGKGAHGRGRGSGSRGTSSSDATVDAESGPDGSRPSPAIVAGGTPRSRGSRSRAARPAGPPEPLTVDGMPAAESASDGSADGGTPAGAGTPPDGGTPAGGGTSADSGTRTDGTRTDGAVTGATVTAAVVTGQQDTKADDASADETSAYQVEEHPAGVHATEADAALVPGAGDEPDGAAPGGVDAHAQADGPGQSGADHSRDAETTGTEQGADPDAESANG
ncbi:MAG TPA: ribonuclease E/G, partial [Streptosporangiaceae bacterium]|nr:ribonuclease E/G [Streptosporangiaceae bacterium]